MTLNTMELFTCLFPFLVLVGRNQIGVFNDNKQTISLVHWVILLLCQLSRTYVLQTIYITAAWKKKKVRQFFWNSNVSGKTNNNDTEIK